MASTSRSEASSEEPSADMRVARVPYGIDLAAQWSWRFVIICIAGILIARAIGVAMVVVLPVLLALFIAALVEPLVGRLSAHMPRRLAALVTVVSVLAVIVAMVAFAAHQVATGADDLARQVSDGLDKIRDWLKDGPLNISDAQIDDAIQGMQDLVSDSNRQVVDRVTQVSTTIGHIVTGFFIILFSTYFFLADGKSIFAWGVRLFPRAARERAESSGLVAWASLTQFVRATVLVALVDAAGIMLVAAVLRVPFVAAIGVLVFLGAFVPLVGATVSGVVAILVALVAHGPIVALVMLGGVIAVQQLEAHVLQPFLMGRFVSVHPLGVILAIAIGVIVAGIPGALIAVPLVAAVNAVVNHLADRSLSREEFPVGDLPQDAPEVDTE